MKEQAVKDRFIELRSEGLSFDKISKELNTSKPILIKWNIEFEKEIKNIQFFKLQALIEKHGLIKQKKVEFFSKEIERITKAIAGKEYTKLSLRELHGLKEDLEKNLAFQLTGVEYETGVMRGTGEMKYDDGINLNEIEIEAEIKLKLD